MTQQILVDGHSRNTAFYIYCKIKTSGNDQRFRKKYSE